MAKFEFYYVLSNFNLCHQKTGTQIFESAFKLVMYLSKIDRIFQTVEILIRWVVLLFETFGAL